MNVRDKILIISKNHPEINADLEIKNIQKALKASAVEVVDPRSLEPGEVISEIRKHQPTGLHFISHGALRKDGTVPVVLLSSASGGAKDLDLRQLTEYLRELGDKESKRFKCIFLNACYVGVWAEELLDCADVIIGTKSKLPEITAQYFAAKFYEHIALDCSVGQAFRDAKHATRMERNGGDELFILSNPAHVADETYFGKVAKERSDDHEWDAYVSYAPQDKERAHRLAAELYELGLDVFLDAWEIVKGDVVSRKLDRAIAKARSGILLISGEALRDKHVEHQYYTLLEDSAEDERRRLIPALFEDAELPSFLKIFSLVDFRGKAGEAYKKEVEQLRWVLGVPANDKPKRRGG